MRERLLLVDGDPRSLRVLDVSLRSAGFAVDAATNGTEAWALLESATPDLIVAATDLGEIDGFELCARLRRIPLGAGIPFILLGSDRSLEQKIRGLEVGADDYLVKPTYTKEILSRIRALLQRRDRDRLAVGQGGLQGRDGTIAADRFSGNIADIAVVDLLQLIESNGRSGIAHLRGANGAPAAIYFRHGKVVDAEAGRLTAAAALARLFSWTAGSFELEWKGIRRKDVIARPSAELVMEGMKRVDDWNRLTTEVPNPNAVYEVDYRLLAERLAQIPDEVNGILRLCDGVRTITQVVEDSAMPDIEALTAMIRLGEQGIVYDSASGRAPHRHAASAGDSPGASPELEGWLGVGSSPFSAGSPPQTGIERSGIGSGPVRQSFADRLEVEARGDSSSADPRLTDVQQRQGDAAPPRRRTAPGFGHPAHDLPLVAPSGATAPLPAVEAIPQPRSEQDNVIQFPTPSDPRQASPVAQSIEPPDRPDPITASASVSTASPADRSGRITASASVSTAPPADRSGRIVGSASASAVAQSFETAEPSGRNGGSPDHAPVAVLVSATPEHSLVVAGLTLPLGWAPDPAEVHAVDSDGGERVFPEPPSVSNTYRGVGPSPTPEACGDGAVPLEVTDRRSGTIGSSGGVVASGVLQPPSGSQPVAQSGGDSPAAVDRSGSRLATLVAEPTVRVYFPDDDISRLDALDELGINPRWRGMRFFAVALAVGALAAVGVTGFRARDSKPESGSGEPASTQPASPAAPGNTSVPAIVLSPSTVVIANPTGTGVAVPRIGPSGSLPAEPPSVGPPIVGPAASPAARAPEVVLPSPAGSRPAGPAGMAPEAANESDRAVTQLLPRASVPAARVGGTAATLPGAPRPAAQKDRTGGPSVGDPAAPGERVGVAPTVPVLAAGSSRRPGEAFVAHAEAPGELEPSVAAKFALQLDECRVAFSRNRIRDAAKTCTAALATNPNSAPALTMLAHVELNRGRLARARELAEQAVAIDANQADAYVIIGGTHQNSGRNREAKVAYRRYLQIAPNGHYAEELRSILNGL